MRTDKNRLPKTVQPRIWSITSEDVVKFKVFNVHHVFTRKISEYISE